MELRVGKYLVNKDGEIAGWLKFIFGLVVASAGWYLTTFANINELSNNVETITDQVLEQKANDTAIHQQLVATDAALSTRVIALEATSKVRDVQYHYIVEALKRIEEDIKRKK